MKGGGGARLKNCCGWYGGVPQRAAAQDSDPDIFGAMTDDVQINPNVLKTWVY
jgi:hypothetical protein